MKRDWFNRGVRMQHQFGEIEGQNDPLGHPTWQVPDFPFPIKRLGASLGEPREMSEYGLKPYRPDSSPICKPSGGYASTQGPVADTAQDVAMPVPSGTIRRNSASPSGAVPIDEKAPIVKAMGNK